MLVFEFQQKQYIALEAVLNKILKLSLDSVLFDIADQLCFFYHDTVIYNDATAGFQGMVFPEKSLITEAQVRAALNYALKHPAQESLTVFNNNGTLPSLKESNKDTYKQGFMDMGKAGSNNALLLGKPIEDSDFFKHRDNPPCVFYLRQHVLPYYLISFDFLKSYITDKGIIADLTMFKSVWDKAEKVPATRMVIERGILISSVQPRLTGDVLRNHINTLSNRIKILQDRSNDNETQLQAALTTIQNLQEQLASRPTDNDSPSRSALRLAGALAIDAHYINIHAERLNGIGDMKKALDILGVRIDEDSIRTVLKLASEKIDKIDIRPDHPAYKK